MPSNQQQIIEQAKFTYSPLGKAFEKQTKTIKDKGEKQIKAIQKDQETKTKRPIKSKFTYDINDSPIVLKENEIYSKLTEESFEKINNLDKKVDIDKLVFKYKGNTPDKGFSKFDNVLDLINKIRDGEICLNEAKNEQTELRSNIGEIKKVQKDIYQKRVKKQEQILKIFIMQEKQLLIFLLNILQEQLKLDVKKEKGTGLKVLTPKQMLQRLSIALVQIKAGNNSESLLHEIRQIVYSLYRSKQITKKVYNNIIKSIKI